MTTIIQVAHLSNEELLAEIKSLAARERRATAALVASLAELDERRLYLGAGSVFPKADSAGLVAPAPGDCLRRHDISASQAA